jgi:hypothetical protein
LNVVRSLSPFIWKIYQGSVYLEILRIES